MSNLTDPVKLLEQFVRFRTDVALGHERPFAEHLAAILQSVRPDELLVVDVPRASGGKASTYVYARFGNPRTLINAHLDTVPPNEDWSADPFAARIEGERLYALGAADTKGAIAAILAATAESRPADTAILFSGDEESTSVAMRAFLQSAQSTRIERAIVCEPTNLRAGTRHRGIASFDVEVSSAGGHSSLADRVASPIAILAKVAVALDAWGNARRNDGPPGFEGMCVNLAKLDGGIAFNVIPPHARLEVSLRPPPGADMPLLRAELDGMVRALAPESTMRWSRDNAPFATRDLASFEPLLGALVSTPMDLGFWTEAALLLTHGIDAVVFGPGNIAQAHGPDEWVPVEELFRARDIFRSMFRHGQL